MTNLKQFISIICLIFICNACATYKPQYANDTSSTFPNKDIQHSFYLIGDAGNYELGTSSEVLKAFKLELENAASNSTAIFLGDNIYPEGFPSKDDRNRETAKKRIEAQTNVAQNFKGRTIFIPGNHDWYSGVKGLKRQEEFVEKALGKNTFLPENGCPIEKIHVSDDIDLILVDSHWYLTNWDKEPTINDNCELNTRDAFLDEFASLIKKARSKTTIVALHHPIYTNGPHGGQYSFKSNLKPLPVIGSLIDVFRKTNGASTVDIQNKHYD